MTAAIAMQDAAIKAAFDEIPGLRQAVNMLLFTTIIPFSYAKPIDLGDSARHNIWSQRGKANIALEHPMLACKGRGDLAWRDIYYRYAGMILYLSDKYYRSCAATALM